MAEGAKATGGVVRPTWRQLARSYPEFVQWIAQRHGGVPDGPIDEADYERFVTEYELEGRRP